MRAKFVVIDVQTNRDETTNTDRYEIRMRPTADTQPVPGVNVDVLPENTLFFAAVPSGSLHLGGVRAVFGEQFLNGDEVYVDFTKVPKP